MVERVLEIIVRQGGNVARRKRGKGRRGEEERHDLADGQIVAFADRHNRRELAQQLIVQLTQPVGDSILHNPDRVVQVIDIPAQPPPEAREAMNTIQHILRETLPWSSSPRRRSPADCRQC